MMIELNRHGLALTRSLYGPAPAGPDTSLAVTPSRMTGPGHHLVLSHAKTMVRATGESAHQSSVEFRPVAYATYLGG